MAEREARIRLRLLAGNYTNGLRQVAQQTQSIMSSMSAGAARAGAAGLASVKSTVASMGTALTSSLATAAKFGGAFAVGAAAKKGLELQQTYKNLAFTLSQATGEAVSWNQVQRTIETNAERTGRTSGEMATAFETIWKATGNARFAADALKSVGTAATASGKDTEKLAEASALLSRKWGATAETLPGMLARMFEKMDAGGASFDDLNARFGSMAGEAAAAGMAGEEGLSQLLGMMQHLDNRVGEKATRGLGTFFNTLRDGSAQLKKLEKDGALKFGPDDDAMGKVRSLLGSAKGRAAAELTFTGDARAIFDELAKPFDEAFRSAKESGKSTKEATAAGQRAFDDSIAAMAKSNASWAKVQEQAADRADDPQRKLAKAMEQFAVEFTKPEALEAMNQLASSLPKVAQGMAKLVNFAVNNPLLAGGAYVGAKIALSFAGGALASAGSTIGAAAATQIRAAAVASGPWRAAGAAVGLAIAAAVAYKFGTDAIDKKADEVRGEASSLTGARAMAESAAVQGSRSYKEEAAKTLRERLGEAESKVEARKGGLLNKVTFGAYSDVAETFAGKDDEMAKSRAALRELEAQLAKTGDGGDKAAKGFDAAGAAAERLAKKLDSMGGGTTAGLPPPAGNVPGFAAGR